MSEEEKFPYETNMEDSSLNCFQMSPRYNQPRMGQIWSSPVDLLPELAELSYESDVDTDDSSKFLNRLFVDDYHGLQVNDLTSSSETDDSQYIIVTLSTLNSRGSEENSDPGYRLSIARSQFEKQMKRRESEQLRTPKSFRLLEIFQETILSPVATLLLKLHAPGEWTCCESCGGFIETHCCLRSYMLGEFCEAGSAMALNFHDV